MSKRRVLGAFLIIVALLVMLIPAAGADAATSASAFSIKCGELVKYNGKDKTVTVPGTVTSIGKGAFENNTYVEKIILPDSVEQIKAYAFWGCDNLKTVTLGKGLSSIGDFAFTNCTGLETMTIPENVHSIGIQAFSDCLRFEDITIPPQVVEIREDAFDGDYLLNIHCEEGSYADKYAKDFYERQKKMSVYDNASGLATIGNGTGSDTNGTGTTNNTQTAVQVPTGIPADGVYSGEEIQKKLDESNPVQDTPGNVIGSTQVVANQAMVLMQNSNIPVMSGEGNTTPSYAAGEIANIEGESISEGMIPERAHYRDETFKEADLTSDVREIGSFAFARSGLNQLTIQDGLEKIGYAAFYHCDGLSEINLPETVNSVEAKAFAHTAWMDEFLSGETLPGTDFLISGGVLLAYRGSAEEVQVPDGVRVIAGEAFADHAEITKILLPSSLQTINDRAFAGCNIMDIQYEGSVFSEDALEESVQLNSLAAGPEEVSAVSAGAVKMPSMPVCIAAGILLLGGLFCIFKERY